MDDDLVRRLREHADRLSSRFGTVELIRSAADALDKFQDFKAIALVELASRVGDDFVARFIVNAWIAGLDTFAIIMPELQESLDAISTTDEALQGSEEAFLSDVYRLVDENLSRKAIAQVFDFLDDKVLAADFEACDRILRAVDLDRLDASTALGFLSITTQVRDRLSHRNGLLQRIERHLLQQRSPEYVETLLRGLR